METVLVTGSSGGIGQVLVPFLIDSGFKVVGLDIRKPNPDKEDPLNFEFIHGSILDSQEILIEHASKIDYVIHLAALSSLPECEENAANAFEVNFLGTVRLIQFFLNFDIKSFINASSSAVYEGANFYPFNESTKCLPYLVYPQTKFMVENYLQTQKITRNFPAISLRFFNVIGPFQDYSRVSPPLVNYLIREYSNNRRPILHSDGNQERDYISVYDICTAIQKAMSIRSSEKIVFNVCSGETLTVRDLDELVRKNMDTKLLPVFRNSEKLWDNYPKMFSGRYGLNRELVSKETTKKSVGSADLFKETTGWKIDFPIVEVIGDICLDAQKYIRGGF